MEKMFCNPLNLEYRYQIKESISGKAVFREAADPTLLLFHDVYYLFASMSGGFWYSDDMYTWSFRETPELPIYDYAPDAREINGEVVFCASKRGENCTLYRSPDPLHVPFQAVSAPFAFWDPDVFQDDDGRVYLYWGCSDKDPVWGIRLDADTLMPIGEKKALICEKDTDHGWERKGENNKCEKSNSDKTVQNMPKPYIEGSFMTKHKGRYYLQYAAPGTELNIYSDGVYVSEKPLGPFSYQTHNPFSSKPGGFITAAGHGSTIQDKYGNWWHSSTMHISVNENFERRIALFPCSFDKDGLLYCNQNFADYPMLLPDGKRQNMDSTSPHLMLLSYNKVTSASSSQEGYGSEKGVDENIRTWWAAKDADDRQWYQVDLGKLSKIQAIQLNFADHKLPIPDKISDKMQKDSIGRRLIQVKSQRTCYLLKGSEDGTKWHVIKDARNARTDYSNDFIVLPEPARFRYIKVSHMKLPMDGVPAISGLRLFGHGDGCAPAAVETVQAQRSKDGLNILLLWDKVTDADGYNVRYGISPGKMYASWQVYSKTNLDLSMVNKGQSYYIAIDSFNENGVTEGKVVFVP